MKAYFKCGKLNFAIEKFDLALIYFNQFLNFALNQNREKINLKISTAYKYIEIINNQLNNDK